MSAAHKNQQANKYEVVEECFLDEQLDKINKKYEFPASFKKAKIHSRAAKFGYNAIHVQKDGWNQHQKQVPERPKLCPCCNLAINTQDIDIFQHTSPQKFKQQHKDFLFNSSNAMLFSFIKMAIIYLLLVFIVCDAFNLFTSIDGSYCLRNANLCQKSIFQMISTYNKFKDLTKIHLLKIQDILCLVVVIGSIIFFIIYRKVQYNIYEKIDFQHQTQDDYTIFVENIPILDFNTDQFNYDQFDYEKKIKKIFQDQIQVWLDWMKGTNHDQSTIQGDLIRNVTQKGRSPMDLFNIPKITTVSLCFNLSELQKVQNQRQKLMCQLIDSHKQQMRLGQQNQYNQVDNMSTIKRQIHKLNLIQVELCRKFAVDNSPTFNITHFVGKAFVSFEYQHYRQYIMQKYEDGSKFFKYSDKPLIISRATHPTDIFWENMQISDEDRRKKVISSYLIITMVLGFSVFALVGIDYIKRDSQKNQKLQNIIIIINYGASILASIFAYLINYGIHYVIVELTRFERHQTLTNQYASLIIKVLITQFINTAFIFYLIQILNQRPYLSSAGLVIQVSFFMVISGFISIVMNAVNFARVVRYVKLFWKYGYTTFSRRQNVLVPTFQIKLNKDFQLPVFDIAARYSYYLLQVYTCMFYSYLVPVGVLAVAMIFTVQYWIDKVNLLKFSSQYYQINYFLSRMILKLFQGSLLMFTLGNLIFSTVINQDRDVSLVNIISMAISLLYVSFITFAPASLERKIFAKYQTFEKLSYNESLENNKIFSKYWTQNPATVFVKQVDLNNDNNYIYQGSVDSYFELEDVLNQTLQNRLENDNYIYEYL